MVSQLPTIRSNPDWLQNEHAGQLLVAEFLEPDALSVAQLAQRIGIAPERIAAVITGARAIDAELDLRLGRYFCMSRAFF